MRASQWQNANPSRSIRELKQEWERLYRDAMLEPDVTRLPKLIADARSAILVRLEDRSCLDGKEMDAIARAGHLLDLLSYAEH